MPRTLLALLLALALSITTLGCGGGETDPDADEMDADTGTTEVATPMGTASIAGTISFSGEAPARAELNLDRECTQERAEAALAQTTVVGDDGGLKWVFVYVKEGLPADANFPAPSEAVVLDQEGCMYEPHVFGVQTGQNIEIVNSDPFQHNVNAQPNTNRGFNVSTPREGDRRERSFREPEVMVRIKCDVHGWMEAWAGVVAHPYFDTTGDDGSFSIDGLPAGTYTIEAWHEEHGTQTQEITVGDGEAATADFAFAPGA